MPGKGVFSRKQGRMPGNGVAWQSHTLLSKCLQNTVPLYIFRHQQAHCAWMVAPPLVEWPSTTSMAPQRMDPL